MIIPIIGAIVDPVPPKLIGRVDERVVAVAELPVKVASVPSVPLSNIDVPVVQDIAEDIDNILERNGYKKAGDKFSISIKRI